MFRRVKSRNNLRHRLSSNIDDKEDESITCGSSGSVRMLSIGASTAAIKQISVDRAIQQQKQQQAEKVNNAEGTQKPQAGVVTDEHHLLSFDNFEGDDISDFKIKRRGTKKRLEKLTKRAKLLQDLSDVVMEKNESVVCGVHIKHECAEDESSSKITPGFGVDCAEEKKEPKEERTCVKQEQVSVTHNKFPSSFQGEIPDAKAVYEARKKRERMRLIGSNGEIPLDDVQRLKDKSVARSRLIREDENDVSDEDSEVNRFYSLKSIAAEEDQRRRDEQMDFLAHEGEDNEGDHEHSDEEVTRWEREQMKKGVSSHKVEMLERERAKMEAVMKAIKSGMELTSESREQLPMEMDIDFSNSETLSVPYLERIPEETGTVSLDEILMQLKKRITDGKESVNFRESECEKVSKQIQENEEIIQKLEMEEPRINERFQIYQDIRAYARDLLECLSEKVDEVKNVEKQMAEILDNRARRLRNRRRNDVHDMYDECSAIGGRPCQPRGNEMSQRASEREARRSRRRRLRENTLEGIAHEEGLSTDDEETQSEIVAREQSINEIRALANVVFVDALDDFCRIDQILSRFVDWLSCDEDNFTNAYIHLCIPKLISLFIRLELIDWEPLESDKRPVSSMRWYENLIKCAAESHNINTEHPIIVSLIPLCIEKVILWKITGATYVEQCLLSVDGVHLVRERWDPLSQKQCKNLSFLLNQLIDECPTLVPTSRSVQKLLHTICLRAQEAIDDDLFVPIYSRQSIENPATGCKAFLDRQTWSAIKGSTDPAFYDLLVSNMFCTFTINRQIELQLIRCLNCFSTILSDEKMRELILDGVINRTMPALQCATISDQSMIRKCRAIIKLIPPSWSESTDCVALRNFKDLLGKVAEEHKYNKEFAKEVKKFVNVNKNL
ncbi:unnamed protein product [Thelazia callipaeda]|uniref:GCFC domain-containing protein n=1 Tax=Thelazia callipaeda TaxID=103827 RepID=A0A0N5CW04_THECL|nr:unnamed protein product [Thelazia callipaeda]